MIFFIRNKKRKESENLKNSGFILLFSLLISSVILAAGLSITRVIIRQLSIATIQKDSQMAFFSADAGLECARYWRDEGAFENDNSQCNGETIKALKSDGNLASKLDEANNITFFFNAGGGDAIDSVEPKKSCVKITLCSNGQGDDLCEDTIQPTRARIISRGYNSECDNNGELVGGRLVERRIDYVYN